MAALSSVQQNAEPMRLVSPQRRLEPVVLALLLMGWLVTYLPTYFLLAKTFWSSDEQGHGPIILAMSAYLLFRKRSELAALSNAANPIAGGILLSLGLATFILGHSQSVFILDVGSQILVLAAMLVIFTGWSGLRLALFPLFFLIFMVPLPAPLVAAVTAPLKLAVSSAASSILYILGFPIGRSGVTLTIGQYQLLVADACAGLNSMFTLEALGLLYLNLMNYKSVARNFALAVAVVPISFCANVFRVIILILVTYFFGDAAGQGFVHGFAGMVLFLVGLTLMISVDSLYGALERRRNSL